MRQTLPAFGDELATYVHSPNNIKSCEDELHVVFVESCPMNKAISHVGRVGVTSYSLANQTLA
jgi:hypothetical protein